MLKFLNVMWKYRFHAFRNAFWFQNWYRISTFSFNHKIKALEQFQCVNNEEMVPHFNVNFSQMFNIVNLLKIMMLVGV